MIFKKTKKMASYRNEVHGELKNQGASEKSKRQQKSYEICQGKCRFTDDTSCTAHFTFDNKIEVCKSHSMIPAVMGRH